MIEQPTVGEAVPKKFKDWARVDWEHGRDWREKARESFEFEAGRQWTQEDKLHLEATGRAPIVFNRTKVVVKAVAGSEINNRQEARFIPRQVGDAAVNEAMTSAAHWFLDIADAEDEDSDSFYDCIVCGMGWVDVRLDYDDNPDGDPLCERMDPLKMAWDKSTSRRNLKDSKRRWQVWTGTAEEARNKFPDYELADIDANWFHSDDEMEENDPESQDPEHWYKGDSDGGGLNSDDPKRVTVLRCQWIEREPMYRAFDAETGQEARFDQKQWETVGKRLKGFGGELPEYVKQYRKVYKQAYFGRVVLKSGYAPSQKDFSMQCITGDRDHTKRQWTGLVEVMKDPQRWANRWLLTMLHIMNTQGMGPLVEEGVFENVEEAERDWSKPNKFKVVTKNALVEGRIKERSGATFPVGFQQLTEFAIDAIRDVTGVNLELMGMREVTQPGVLEYQRRQAGMSILGVMFDSLRRYRKAQGRLLLDYIQNYLSDGRLVRIVGEEGEKYVPLMKQEDVSEYDVIVDDSPSNPNQKEATWQVISQMMPGIQQFVTPQILMEILDYSPLPKSLVEKVKKIASEPDPQQQQQQALQFRKAVADVAKAEADAEKTGAEIGKVASEVDENRAQTEHTKVKTKAEALDAGVRIAQAFEPPPVSPAA